MGEEAGRRVRSARAAENSDGGRLLMRARSGGVTVSHERNGKSRGVEARGVGRRAGTGGFAIGARAAMRDAPGSSAPSLQSQYSSFTLDLWITVVPPSHRSSSPR